MNLNGFNESAIMSMPTIVVFLDKKDDFLYPQYTRIITRKEKSAAVSALSLNNHIRRTGGQLLPGML
jgi:hypothetical protein